MEKFDFAVIYSIQRLWSDCWFCGKIC